MYAEKKIGGKSFCHQTSKIIKHVFPTKKSLKSFRKNYAGI
jgi:hypothetical protein